MTMYWTNTQKSLEGNPTASITTNKAAILIYDGSSWLHIPIVTTTS